jgi:hypothetical protein
VTRLRARQSRKPGSNFGGDKIPHFLQIGSMVTLLKIAVFRKTTESRPYGKLRNPPNADRTKSSTAVSENLQSVLCCGWWGLFSPNFLLNGLSCLHISCFNLQIAEGTLTEQRVNLRLPRDVLLPGLIISASMSPDTRTPSAFGQTHLHTTFPIDAVLRFGLSEPVMMNV